YFARLQCSVARCNSFSSNRSFYCRDSSRGNSGLASAPSRALLEHDWWYRDNSWKHTAASWNALPLGHALVLDCRSLDFRLLRLPEVVHIALNTSVSGL